MRNIIVLLSCAHVYPQVENSETETTHCKFSFLHTKKIRRRGAQSGLRVISFHRVGRSSTPSRQGEIRRLRGGPAATSTRPEQGRSAVDEVRWDTSTVRRHRFFCLFWEREAKPSKVEPGGLRFSRVRRAPAGGRACGGNPEDCLQPLRGGLGCLHH